MTSQALLLDIEGMKCGGCVSAVEKRLLAQPGVLEASVNLLSRTAWVELEPTAQADYLANGLLESLAGLGFPGRIRSQQSALEQLRASRAPLGWWQRWRELVIALVLLVISSAAHLSETGPLADMRLHGLVASIALLGPGRLILVRGWQGLRSGVPAMDTLVGLGVFSAYLASLVALIWPGVGWSCFFNEPLMLLGFVLLGRFLEDRAKRRTGDALEALADLQPNTALLLLGDDLPRPVRVGGLRPGDRLRILPGDRLPVDGKVISGCSSVDESGLTGEPMPRLVQVGAELSAGGLNLQSPLELEVLRSGADSALARLIELVQRAQASKAPIQALADRWAGRFTWIVLALAALTFLFWWLVGTQLFPEVLHGLSHGHGHHRSLGAGANTPVGLALQLAIAVLVVACPCALGLATPTAISVATGRAARLGLLFRGGEVLQVAAEVRTVLFDKTGTLTRGRPLVEACLSLADGLGEQRLLQLAASLEQHTRHPLAWALLQAAESRGLPLLACSASSTIAGAGVEGKVEGMEQLCRLGSLNWLEQQGVVPLAEALAWQLEHGQAGATVLAMAHGKQLLGLLAVRDALRPDAAAAVQRLKQRGYGLGILSGDRQGPVQQLAGELGFEPEQLGWGLSPAQKLAKLEAAAAPVAMVGDGLNDAPALAAANLGIAVGTGTQIAQDSADLVVLGDRLMAVPQALELAQRCMAKVRQNLVWAFGYNLLVLPLAAGVLLPGFGLLLTPPLAALLMAMSSLTVVANALLLKLP
ncbi:cation-translocating P-type ATPase [Synechococcus sp. UW140]|uniref:heavy metal translocating P-type ATPase n=1 Tax=Synechococcus sp. UW140 TaxID=368503 RepID=UPI0031383B70